MDETFVMGENMRILLARSIVKSTAPTSQESSQEKAGEMSHLVAMASFLP